MCGFCIYGTGGSPIYREYLEVMLTSPLIIGKTYSAEMYVSHGDYTQYASNNIGMYFSDTLVNTPNIMTPLNFIPQINENTIITNDTGWVKISGTFIATSPAQYLILGNFHNNFNTSTIFYSTRPKLNAYYYVDDVSVIEIIPCILESDDTKICEGSSATLIAHSNSLIGWAVDTLPDVIISSDSIIVVTPYHTTSYLAISNCDTISVMVDVISNCDIGIEFPNVFTPNNDGMNDNFIPIKYKGVSNANLSIYNRWGVQIFYTENLRIGWNGFHNSSICSEGIYYWIVQYTSVTNESKDLKGFLTLLK
jgi:gliding motility-associated-like protein